MLALAPTPAALGHGNAADHLAEDSVHDVAAEPRMAKHTRAVTAADARAAAAAVAGNEHNVGQWGPVVDWPVVGVHVALMPNGKVLAYDSVGDNATETYPVHDHTRATRVGSGDRHADAGVGGHGLQRLLQRARAPDGRAAVPRRRQPGLRAERHPPDARLRPRHEHLEPGAGHGGRALVPDRHAAAQRRDADHLGRRERPRGAHDGRRPAVAELRVAEPAAVPVDRRGAGRARVRLRARTRRCAASTRAAPAPGRAQGPRDAINRDYGSHALYDIGKILVAGGGPLDGATRA